MKTPIEEPKVELKLSPAELRKQVEDKIREVAQSQITHFYEETGLTISKLSIDILNNRFAPNYGGQPHGKGPKVSTVITKIS